MQAFSDKLLQFSEKLTRFMGFLFCGTHCIAHSVCCDVILGAISRLTDSPGTVIISDASNMRGQRSLNFG